MTKRLPKHERITRLTRRLQGDHLMLAELYPPPGGPQRDRFILLHALRVAVIQEICLLAPEIPAFSPQHGLTRDDVAAWILALDVSSAIHRLAQIFPNKQPSGAVCEDFGEPSTYRPEAPLSYAVEHEKIFEPISRLYEIAPHRLRHNLRIGALG
jgi:phosphoenolpyruvate carboxylase